MKAKSLVSGRKGNPTSVLVVGLIVMFVFCFVPVSYGATAKEIEANVDAALKLFEQVKGGNELLPYPFSFLFWIDHPFQPFQEGISRIDGD